MISTAPVASAGQPLGAGATLRPEPRAGDLQPERARPRPEGAEAAPRCAARRVDRSSAFLIHQLLAVAPDLGPPPPSRRLVHAAYQAHLARRIRHSGPATPVDLRV